MQQASPRSPLSDATARASVARLFACCMLVKGRANVRSDVEGKQSRFSRSCFASPEQVGLPLNCDRGRVGGGLRSRLRWKLKLGHGAALPRLRWACRWCQWWRHWGSRSGQSAISVQHPIRDDSASGLQGRSLYLEGSLSYGAGAPPGGGTGRGRGRGARLLDDDVAGALAASAGASGPASVPSVSGAASMTPLSGVADSNGAVAVPAGATSTGRGWDSVGERLHAAAIKRAPTPMTLG